MCKINGDENKQNIISIDDDTKFKYYYDKTTQNALRNVVEQLIEFKNTDQDSSHTSQIQFQESKIAQNQKNSFYKTSNPHHVNARQTFENIQVLRKTQIEVLNKEIEENNQKLLKVMNEQRLLINCFEENEKKLQEKEVTLEQLKKDQANLSKLKQQKKDQEDSKKDFINGINELNDKIKLKTYELQSLKQQNSNSEHFSRLILEMKEFYSMQQDFKIKEFNKIATLSENIMQILKDLLERKEQNTLERDYLIEEVDNLEQEQEKIAKIVPVIFNVYQS